VTLSALAAYRLLLRPQSRLASSNRFPAPRQWSSNVAMHDYFIERFVESDGFGSERMASTFTVSHDHRLRLDGQVYQIESIELISLRPRAALRRKAPDFAPRAPDNAVPTTRPFAYREPFNGTKAHLQQSPRRPLRQPELAAIDKLLAGDQTVFDPTSTPPLLVGGVRATLQCLKCHEVPPGKLLGAFCYSLRPIPDSASF
jgi:hypothetical protein